MVVRTAAMAVNPPTAALLPPSDPAALLPHLLRTAADPRAVVSPEMLELARMGAASSPLAFEPFFVHARREEQEGRLDRAIKLMEEARRRRPHHLLVRLQLTAYYQQSRRFGLMFHELDWVLRRSDEARRVLLPELVKLLRDDEGREMLAIALARDPEWRSEFLRVAGQQPVAPHHALALVQSVRRHRLDGGAAPELRLYLNSLIQQGQYDRARAVWLETLPDSERHLHANIFDGGFRGVPAEPPFGWSLTSGEAGRAEMVSQSSAPPHLKITYFGGSNVVLARQTLSLREGRYRVSVRSQSDTGIRSGDIYLSISCLPSERRLVRVSFAEAGATYRQLQETFSVPASCAGQVLRIAADAGDIAAAVDVALAQLEIRRES